MQQQVIENVKAHIRSGVRMVDAKTLRGDVRVVHWDSIREALEGSLAQLKAEIQGLMAKQGALQGPQAELQAARGELHALRSGPDDIGILKAELAAAKKLLLEFEDAYDFLAVVADFDLDKFQAACTDLRAATAEVSTAYAGRTGAPLPLDADGERMIETGRVCEEKLRELCSAMLEGKADVSTVVDIVRIAKAGERLWARLDAIREYVGYLARLIS